MTARNAPPGYLSSAKNMAAKILRDSDSLGAIIEFMDQLPPLLVESYMRAVDAEESKEESAEIEISDSTYAGIIYPGDIIIKKNREPKVGDVLSIILKSKEDNEYYRNYAIVKKINIKEGSLYVQNIEKEKVKGFIAPHMIGYVLERVVKFGTPEWDSLVEMLKIWPDKQWLVENIKDDIEFIGHANFHEKEKKLKALKNRLEYVETLL